VTHYTYDAKGRVIEKERAGQRTQITYDSLGREVRVVEQGVRVTVKEYDLLDRVIEERGEDLSGRVYRLRRYTYDAQGNIVEEVDGERVLQRRFNCFGQVIWEQDGVGAVIQVETRYDYPHEEGYCVKCQVTTDPIGNRSHQIFDRLGREVCFFKEDVGGTLLQRRHLSCDACSNLVEVTEDVIVGGEVQGERQLHFSYDSMHRKIEQREADRRRTQIFYNASDLRERVLKADGVELTYTYNLAGLVMEIKSSDGTVHYRYTYDRLGHCTLVQDVVNQRLTKRSYDAWGDLLCEEMMNGLGVAYERDELGRPIVVELGGRRVLYGYCGLDLAFVDYGGRRFGFSSYDLSGSLLKMVFPSGGGEVFYEWDGVGRLTGIFSDRYCERVCYDCLGNMVESDKVVGGVVVEDRYGYDALSQLVRVSGDWSEAFCYDSVYNPVERNGSLCCVDLLNQLTFDGSSEYFYDEVGRLVAVGDDVHFCYDALDRLTLVVRGGEEYVYWYDEGGRRMGRISGGVVERFLYLGMDEVGRCDGVGDVLEFRVLGVGRGAEIGATCLVEVCGDVYFAMSNVSGHLVEVVRPGSGEVVGSYWYSAFGMCRSFGVGCSWGFGGKRLDIESGFYFFGRRYYSPILGRFVTCDPLSYSAGVNVYAYVNNNPFSRWDDYGLYTRSRQARQRKFANCGGQCQGGWLCQTRGSVGSGVKMFGDHLCPVPLVRDAFSIAGRALSGEKVHGYRMACDRPFSSAFNLGLPELSMNERVLVENGILTTEVGVRDMAGCVSDHFGGTNVHYVHNATGGFSADLVKTGLHKLNPYSAAVRSSVDKMRELISDQQVNRVNYFVHSAGGLIAYDALTRLTPEEMCKIYVVTLGSAAIIPPRMAFSVRNFVNSGDLVPFIASPLAYCGSSFFGCGNIEFMPSSSNPFTFNDHLFYHENYQSVIDNEGRKFRNRNGLY